MKRCEYDRLVKLVGNLATEGAAQEFASIAGTPARMGTTPCSA